MKSIAWMTFSLATALSLALVSKSSLDQSARNLAATSSERTQFVARSATAVREADTRELSSLKNVLEKSFPQRAITSTKPSNPSIRSR